MFVHGSNLARKEEDGGKYTDATSRQYLAEIRERYDAWSAANAALIGPTANTTDEDKEVVSKRVALLSNYKDFIDDQKYAEHFDSRSNLHSSVIEEFVFYLFRDLAASFGSQALIGRSRSFKDIFFNPPNFKAMLEQPHAKVERKDHDFVIGVTVNATMTTAQQDPRPYQESPAPNQVREAQETYGAQVFEDSERHRFDLPAVAIECKTYLDKTMLEASSRAADELKNRCPNALYIVVMEWLKLTENINLMKYQVDQIYVFRKQRNTDREFRFLPDYEKNPLDSDVVWHLFLTVRRHLTQDWEGGVIAGLKRGWLK